MLVGEEWEDGQQQEPTKECDDWGLYGQAMDGDGYHTPPAISVSINIDGEIASAPFLS
jgi:hypothetical protein